MVKPVNVHDSKLIYESFFNLLEVSESLELDIVNSYLTLDSGFDNWETRTEIFSNGLIPVIKPNLRGLKDRKKINKILDGFSKVKHIYKERYTIERCFAWEDTYRKLVIRYEKLPSVFMGFRYLAFSMINFRNVF